ncbi:phospho-N-acetylmuramoyl-pentapeptide-transferase [Cellulomonas sp. zg-ZUI222]|uniref:Phospho-N-acetylmuramoyl-pentapeptide-transferase n=1 Tax=Cellulomonas wangleii TaxID=2816956 RepID=A0ABX8D8J7_9CELL|nr:MULTISPECIES: phospho-N-acetylmuramoyl-pentapeptide-transferase [Cellulomonas]MBO0900618.1 phospho-N-acetylmuramoyl-pentapeptide-transferase [Cellulomonas sp. zg-ZUI22]MBO0921286.1 phospho-N-acetylmuramoyl-pentapeptide-transferase [Cellulomonas wangleii]MBO0925702.1 phospho-N-acetylmuramoyl-pentapeptide-transferase [Cellulomonas wangleii]QVI63769.1 phospho-N-acetylmuramoyl-pentapeptide-transferase [Cellulomonas wangleii]SFK36963.1 Phospho-N-acetylmuramoyl-pentapeptide-transferase [Cellulomo
MRAVLISGGISMLVALLGTPLFIRFLVKRQYGQFIRQDGPTAHFTKRGTPTMGGVVIIGATLVGWGLGLLLTGTTPSASALLALFLMTGLGVVGFLDDFIKISRQRSLGLSPLWKIVGQGVVGVVFSVLALQFPNEQFRTPASTRISFIRDTGLDLAFAGATVGLVLFVIWANFLITAWSNAVNLTDGLDGLATGVSLIVFGAYVLVGVWQFNQTCQKLLSAGPRCYETRDPLDLAVVAAAITGALFGFLWWNASPAKIFMGDTGSLALGGALAALTILTRTEILGAIIGGLFVLIVLSDVIQIGFFKMTGRRVFKMAPLHHHFELSGWGEVTIVIRFWIIAGLFVALGVGIFYAEWVAQ